MTLCAGGVPDEAGAIFRARDQRLCSQSCAARIDKKIHEHERIMQGMNETILLGWIHFPWLQVIRFLVFANSEWRLQSQSPVQSRALDRSAAASTPGRITYWRH